MSPLIISPLIASLPLLFCLAFHFTNATTTISTRTDTILPGQSLDTTYWIGSTGGSYFLCFFSPEKNSTKLYLVIRTNWDESYDDIVWVANREHPFPNSSAAVLTFNQDGNLVISDGSLLYVMTNTSGGDDTYAKLLDTGNLILTNRASHILWQSFDYPTDTLLPGMKLKDAKTGWSLTSWKSHEDPAPGLFSLQYLASRKEVVLMKGSEQYWSSPLIDHLADIFVIDGDSLTLPSTDENRKIRLDISGNLLLQTYIYNWDDWEGDWFSFCLHDNNNISCTTTDTIRPGQSLNTSETIVSANGRYELGLFPSQEDYYCVGIRYYNFSGANVVVRNNPLLFPTVVWVANREDSFLTSSSILTLNPDLNLVISDGRLIYNLTNTSGGNDTYARLLNTGNLVLKNRASHILWQSFDYPTDTLLPGMKLKDAKTGWSLTSWKSHEDPAPGLFSLQYLGSRKEVVLMNGSEQYWSSPLIDQLADIFMIDGDYLTWPSTNDIRRIRLDIYGNLLLQTWMGSDWFSFCLRYNNINCITTDTIRAGQSLNASETIVSANRRYELGFFPTEYNPEYYTLGIRYNNVYGDNYSVWVVDTFESSSDFLTLDSDGNLLASYGNLTNISDDNETYARLLDTGNLVLKNRTSHILWQSFDHPTNTILPGMKVKDAETGWSLTSYGSYAGSYNSSFSLQYLASRKELILMEKWEAYWISSLSRVFVNTYGVNITFTDIFVIEGEYITLRSNYTNIDISRIWLDISGNLIMESRTSYGSPKSDNLTTSCGAHPACGEFSICKETADAVFKCDCLPGFKAYPDRGCMRNTYLSCSNGTGVQKDGFLPMSNVFLPSNSRNWGEVGNMSNCESACLNNCSCIGYAYDHQKNSCLQWEGPALLRMRQFSEDNTYTKEFYLKLAHADLVPKDTNSTNGNNQLWKIVIPTASIAVLVTLGLFVYYVTRRKLGRKGEDLLLLDLGMTQRANNSEDGDSREVQMPLFSFASVSIATDNFSTANKLGEGGFGPVYKGILLKGDEVAIKRLSKRSGQGWEELKNEAMLIAKLQHKNLVRLLGCCIEQDEKILVYEYMPNTSLDFFLFDREKRRILDWRTRVGVIEGIAQGLLYLHQYSRLRIIHRDLKPSNILLDIDMNPKISDFGMARIFGGNESQANTNRIVGTYGYMSPEYALEGLFSIKSDVFSFGVLLLEIVSGRKNTGFYQTDSLHLIGYAWELWTSDRGSDLVDPLLDDISSMHMALRYVNIALLCVQESAEDRPTMSDVVTMLSNEGAVLPYPKEPAFLNVRSMSKANPINSEPQICSLNGATISTMEGR